MDFNQRETEELREKIEKSIDLKNKEDLGKNLAGTQEEGLTDKEKLEIKNAKNVIKEVTGIVDKPSVQMKKLLDEEQKVPPEDQFYPEQIVATNKKKLDISKNINKINNPPKQEKNKENSKKINIEIMIPKELTAYVSVTILKNFATEKIDKFIKRQEIFYKNNYQKKEKIIKDNEDENKLIYTFEPKVNNSLRKLYKNDNLSVGKRLYNDSLIRRNKKKENNIVNIPKNLSKKSFNQKKILELYEDYNIRKEKNEKLIKKIEKECGYTYVPSVLHKKKFGQKTVNKVQYNKDNNTNNNNQKILKKNKSCGDKSFGKNKNK